MPYSPTNLPANVKKLSPHKRKIWRAAFNAAYGEYAGDESKAFATAWAAANGKTQDGIVVVRKVDAISSAGGITARAKKWKGFRAFIDAFSAEQPRHGSGKWSPTGAAAPPPRGQHEVSRNQTWRSRRAPPLSAIAQDLTAKQVAQGPNVVAGAYHFHSYEDARNHATAHNIATYHIAPSPHGWTVQQAKRGAYLGPEGYKI